jgi:hypothetical protein
MFIIETKFIQVKKISVEIKWALIFAVMQMLWMLLERLVGLHSEHIDKHPVYTNFIAIPSILIYFFALYEKRIKCYGDYMPWKNGFLSGLIMTVFITLLTPLILYISVTFITPDFFSNAIKYAVATEKSVQADAEKYFSFGNYLVQSLIGAPLMGILTSAVVAVFTRGKKTTV